VRASVRAGVRVRVRVRVRVPQGEEEKEETVSKRKSWIRKDDNNWHRLGLGLGLV
jgi:hypothetical protein